jgi:hypothetical protein
MARPKRPPHPVLGLARDYLSEKLPKLCESPLSLHLLDGPPGSPRFAVSVQHCDYQNNCPLGVDPAEAKAKCPHINCELRESARLLIDREGTIIKVLESGTRWD